MLELKDLPCTITEAELLPFSSGMQNVVGNIKRVNGQVIEGVNAVGKIQSRVGAMWDGRLDVRYDQELIHALEVPTVRATIHENVMLTLDGKQPKLMPYLIVQERAEGPEVTEAKIAEDPNIREQVRKILEASFNLYRERNMGLDLLGFKIMLNLIKGVFPFMKTWAIPNIMQTDEHNCALIDTKLLDPASAKTGFKRLVNLMIELEHEGLALILKKYYPDIQDKLPKHGFTARLLARLLYFFKSTCDWYYGRGRNAIE